MQQKGKTQVSLSHTGKGRYLFKKLVQKQRRSRKLFSRTFGHREDEARLHVFIRRRRVHI